MAGENIWFPFYIGDYLADTMHLDHREHGIYLLLLCAYYRNRGPLEDDDKLLANICRMTVTDWQATRSAFAKFFQIQEGKWFHRRADFEIKKRNSAQVARIEAARVTNEKLGRGNTTRSPSRSPSRSPTRRTDAIPQSQSQSDVLNRNSTSFSSNIPPTETLENARLLIRFLNQSTGRKFREVDASLKPIRQRLSEPDVTFDGCMQVISRQTTLWKGTAMEEYLRPETLFGKTKFNSYYAAKDQPLPPPPTTNGYQPPPPKKDWIDKEIDRL